MRSVPFRAVVILALSAALVGGSISPALAQQAPGTPSDAAKGDADKASKEDSGGDRSDVDARYKALTRQAAKAYADEDYQRALALFEQAYALKPVANLRYNMGRIEEKRGNFDEAIAHYETFVGLPGVDIKARKDALDRLNTLREVVALRQKDRAQDSAAAQNDPAGQHEDRGLASANRNPDGVQNREPVRVERDYTAAYITLGLALASYGTSGFFALQARQANTDFEGATTRSARRDAASTGETSSLVADSMLGLGVVMTGLSVYFFLSPSETEVPADQTAMHLSPRLGPEGAGMTFSVEF